MTTESMVAATSDSSTAIVDHYLPTIVVFSSLFPSSAQPNAGLFIRERMFRLRPYARGLIVVAPQPWFPFQSFLRLIKPGYRPTPPKTEIQDGVTVLFPRFLSVPGLFRWLDSFSMAVCTFLVMRRLRHDWQVGIIDAHFAYPCGHAAVLLGRWLGLPVSITLRGTEVSISATRWRRRLMLLAVNQADQVISVSDSLRRHLADCGADARRIEVVGNGVDSHRFIPMPRAEARTALGVAEDALVLISVGGLVERKGFHRVIEQLPGLLEQYPKLRYLIVGGGGPEGDWRSRLESQVRQLQLTSVVTFLGPLPPDELKGPLSASDVFVLATRNEGWANVFLEAMACGLPVVTTDVGGNQEVVCDSKLGMIVPFGDGYALSQALRSALSKPWDRLVIRQYAEANDWRTRVNRLYQLFALLTKKQQSF